MWTAPCSCRTLTVVIPPSRVIASYIGRLWTLTIPKTCSTPSALSVRATPSPPVICSILSHSFGVVRPSILPDSAGPRPRKGRLCPPTAQPHHPAPGQKLRRTRQDNRLPDARRPPRPRRLLRLA